MPLTSGFLEELGAGEERSMVTVVTMEDGKVRDWKVCVGNTIN